MFMHSFIYRVVKMLELRDCRWRPSSSYLVSVQNPTRGIARMSTAWRCRRQSRWGRHVGLGVEVVMPWILVILSFFLSLAMAIFITQAGLCSVAIM